MELRNGAESQCDLFAAYLKIVPISEIKYVAYNFLMTAEQCLGNDTVQVSISVFCLLN
jgi:hypothetical protein